MLTRAARRRHVLRCIDHAADRIQLPWLCPALTHSRNPILQIRTTVSRPLLPRTTRLTSQPGRSRKLASAATSIDDFDNNDDKYLPFAYDHGPSSIPQRYPKHATNLQPLDLSKILRLDDTTSLPPSRLQSHTNTELRGNTAEIEATLEACLQVQRWTRAFVILEQLTRLYQGHTVKLQQVYNRVLEAMVFDLIYNRNKQNQTIINQWVEVHMEKAQVKPNAETFALKIKAALATLDGTRRDRTVRRYWELAKQYEFDNQVASLRHILTDNDLGKLTEICPLKIDFELQAETTDEKDDVELEPRDLSQSPVAVRETEQKGLGLSALRQSLAVFRDTKPNDNEAYAQARQRRLEHDALRSALDRWKVEHEKRMKMGRGSNLTTGQIGALLWQWHEKLTAKIEEELRQVEKAEASQMKTSEDRARCEYGPFLRLLDPESISALTTMSTIQVMSKLGITSPIKLVRMVTEIGRTIEEEVKLQKTKDRKAIEKAAKKAGSISSESLKSAESQGQTSSVLHESGIHQRGLHWTASIHAKVGAILCELFFSIAKLYVTKTNPQTGASMSVASPVFVKQITYQVGRRIGTVTLLPEFRDILIRQPPADMIAKQLPMICEPRPWTGFAKGGYLESRQQMLRVKFDDVAQREYAEAAAKRGDLDRFFTGLDVLGKTGWRINRKVFKVMLEAWNSGEAVANLPPLDKVFPEVPKPGEDATPRDKWKWYIKMRNIENEKSGLHSNRCFQNFQMEIAYTFLGETFYLPHNADFRGRAYPIPPYLNQMGADNARGLLLFAQGRALGAGGLRWLQIHLANVFGYDKASLTDRAQFALDHMDDIRDSIHNPLTGKRWWLQAEDPWQCLATCHELTQALNSPDPTQFVSHLPIHQDGSCNGLQHYAALGGDIAGARQVNLEPGDKPADVYSGVLELVKADIRKEAEEGLELAKLLDGRLTRKIVKQTVMTNVYGVTFTGAIRQVRKQVDDLLPDLKDQYQAGPAAMYIARKIFKGLGTLFEGAHDIQYWLGDCASRITHSISPAQLDQLAEKEFNGDTASRAVPPSALLGPLRKGTKQVVKMIDATDFRSTVIWTTPLQLPVVQPYRIRHSRIVSTNLQHISLAEPSVSDAVDPRKQLQGFPPNFIHSLDATHMMLSAMKARELGLTFSAVHDSFWTHAADIDDLNILLREAFIRMHSEDIIGRLAAEFKTRYQGHLYLAKIGRGSILARKIGQYRSDLAKAVRAQGRPARSVKEQRYDELVREIERRRLLSSEDPVEREKGQQMLTAAVLFEQFHGDRYLPKKVSLGQTAIGEVPDIDPHAIEEALHAGSPMQDINMESTLDPLVDHEEPDTHETAEQRTKAKKIAREATWLWLPLTFKEVPKKGEFNVERLRDSTYFFS